MERKSRNGGLTAFEGRPAGKLSGGMKQKLGLACALAHEPRVLLLDEPTNGVDPVSRRDFWKILHELAHERGATVFVSTAYLDEAERCARLALLHEGRFLALDTPAGVKRLVPGTLYAWQPRALWLGMAVSLLLGLGLNLLLDHRRDAQGVGVAADLT